MAIPEAAAFWIFARHSTAARAVSPEVDSGRASENLVEICRRKVGLGGRHIGGTECRQDHMKRLQRRCDTALG
jgi:hypothetical protein